MCWDRFTPTREVTTVASESDDRPVYSVEPAHRQTPWRPIPSQLEQALEAARDDPTLTELTGMLLDLPMVWHVTVDGDDERWRPTTIMVNLEDDHGRGTDDVIRLMRRAGWVPTSVCFSRNRLTFEVIGETDSDGGAYGN